MQISAKPFYIKTNNRKSHKDINNTLIPWQKLSYSENGKSALISSIMNLGIEKDSLIACPAFICKDVPESLTSFGYKIHYFDINDKLAILNSELDYIINNKSIKVIILVEYFGLTNIYDEKILEKIKSANKIIILDRCHSAISGNNTNIFNYVDAIIFSFKKFLNVRNGGAILFKHNRLDRIKINQGFNFKDLIFEIKSFLEKIICLLNVINIYSNRFYNIKDRLKKSNLNFKFINKTYYKNSKLLNILSDTQLLHEVRSARKSNYKKLVNLIKEKRILFNIDKDSNDFVPQVLPIKDFKGGLLEHLRDRGIATYRWPGKDMPNYIIDNKHSFKNSMTLNNKIVCVPVHHSLNAENLTYISESINLFY